MHCNLIISKYNLWWFLVSDINFKILQFFSKFTTISTFMLQCLCDHRVCQYNLWFDILEWLDTGYYWIHTAGQLTTEYYTQNSDCLHLKLHYTQGYGCHHHQLLQFKLNEAFRLSVAHCSLLEAVTYRLIFILNDCQQLQFSTFIFSIFILCFSFYCGLTPEPTYYYYYYYYSWFIGFHSNCPSFYRLFR